MNEIQADLVSLASGPRPRSYNTGIQNYDNPSALAFAGGFMLDFVLIGFIVSAILVFLFVFLNEGHRQRREEAIRRHPHVATAIQDIQGHPRIAKAIGELQDAIAYMEAAPHDFGGHKSTAIQHARAAIEQLRRAMVYRALR